MERPSVSFGAAWLVSSAQVGHHVPKSEGMVGDLARLDPAGPAGEKGDADAAFGQTAFGAAEGAGGVEILGVMAAFLMGAVVGTEEDERVFCEAELLEFVEEAADVAVETGDGRGELAFERGPGFAGIRGVVSDFDAVAGVATEFIVGVGDGGGEVEKERFGLVRVEELERTIEEKIRGVLLPFAAPVAGEFQGVVAVEEHVGVIHVGLRLAEETEEGVPTFLRGIAGIADAAEAPLAEHAGCVARFFEELW